MPLAQVLPRPQLMMLPSKKTWSFWNLFEFSSGRNHLKNQYFQHSESKSYQIINSIKFCSSRSFQQQHQMHIPIPSNFSGTI
jgi:hypothetical protein